ncbi:MAG: hypothetical protein P8M81_03310 [Litorivicinaceae bacterium]|jgi:LDH2 family malate/lactate/ureidoglycolate dehydrogenase|nr:hypothetical protein [Litorivicinaceae bacterium]
MNSQEFRVVPHRDAFRFAVDSLTTQGVPDSDAKTTAEGLVDADLCGVDTPVSRGSQTIANDSSWD